MFDKSILRSSTIYQAQLRQLKPIKVPGKKFKLFICYCRAELLSPSHRIIAQWIVCWFSLERMLSSPICGKYSAVCTGSILGVQKVSFANSLAPGSLETIYAKPNTTLNNRRVWVSIGFELGHCERLITARQTLI
jgi:hypothetical protein